MSQNILSKQASLAAREGVFALYFSYFYSYACCAGK